MKPIHFKEETDTLAKDQPQFRPLPVCIMREVADDPESIMRFTCKYELTDLELQQIIKTKSIFINQFGFGFHPIYPQVDSPFSVLPINYRFKGNRMYDLWYLNIDGKRFDLIGIQLELIIGILVKATSLQPEQFIFVEEPKIGIDEGGKIVQM